MSRQVPAILNQLMEVLLSDAKCVKQCSRGSWTKSSDACGLWMGPRLSGKNLGMIGHFSWLGA